MCSTMWAERKSNEWIYSEMMKRESTTQKIVRESLDEHMRNWIQFVSCLDTFVDENECFELALRVTSKNHVSFERKIETLSIKSLIVSVSCLSYMNESAWIFIYCSCRTTSRIMQLRSRLRSLKVETFQRFSDSHIRSIWILLRLFDI